MMLKMTLWLEQEEILFLKKLKLWGRSMATLCTAVGSDVGWLIAL